MTHVLAFALAAVAVILLIDWVAHRTGIPAAALLTVSGIVYATLPGPNVELEPELILTFVLPPLLYSAALNSSLMAIRSNLRSVISLSVGLVLATALLVGWGVSLVVPGITLAAGIALGAAVAPPDPVAALAIGRRAGLPPKLITLIEGEGLLNDATALTVFTVATAAAVSGDFSLAGFGGAFLLAAVGGLVVGCVTALAVRVLQARLDEPVLINSVSLATPFVAYLLGEELHVSGVLAVVVAGLIIGHAAPRVVSGASRLQTTAVWRLVDFLLEGFVFLLIGQQLPRVLEGLQEYPASTVVTVAAATVGIVLLLRPLWLVLTQSLPRRLHTRLGGDQADDRRLSGREVLIMSWSGTRGIITLASIFSLPALTDSGSPFPGRDLLLFSAYLVVLVTLIGQGVTFAPVVRATGLRADRAAEARDRNLARAASVRAALSCLEQLSAEDDTSDEDIASLRAALNTRLVRYQHRLDILEDAEDGQIPVSAAYEAAVRTRQAIIDAEREEILRWRDAGRLSDESLRTLQRELDFQERTLPQRDT